MASSVENFVFTVLKMSQWNMDIPDYSLVLTYLKQNRILPLFYYYLSKQNISIEANFLQALKEENKKTILKTLKMETVFREILVLLKNEKIEVIVLKGFSLAHSLYAEKHLRSMADIDFLVRETDFKRTSEILQRAGAELKNNYTISGVDDIKHDLTLWYKGVMVEIHRHIIPLNEKVTISADILFNCTTNIEIYGLIYKTFEPELLLFYLLHHFERHSVFGISRLSWLMDFHYFFAKYNSTFSVEKFNYWIRLSGADNSIYYGLQICQQLMDTKTSFAIPQFSNPNTEVDKYLQLCSNSKNRKNNIGSYTLLRRSKGLMMQLRYLTGKLYADKQHVVSVLKIKDTRLWFLYIPLFYGRYMKKLVISLFSSGK